MAALKAGRFHDFANSMAAQMEAAMQEEWRRVHGHSMPHALGAADRRILFAAIARGVLRYLYIHRGDLVTSREYDDMADGHEHIADFELQDP